jgi:hypothetical protein
MELSEEQKIARMKNRKRTNILHKPEFFVIEFLCKILPLWMTPNVLTGIGFIGSLISFVGILLANENKYYFILSIIGLAIQWFGDSLDGRIAYYRNSPRKWYGWVLDMNLDWISTAMIAIGIYFYFPDYKFMAIFFLSGYGLTYILAIMRYKVTDIYLIDADGLLGPTELRILTCVAFLGEIFVPNFFFVFGVIATVVVNVMNFFDFFKILKLADERDKRELAEKKDQ